MLAPDYQTDRRMGLKSEAVPLPELAGKRVLDVGCDMGWWCRRASDLGAADVLGLDRNRKVRGAMTDLITLNREHAAPRTRFEQIDLGRQWHVFGRFDVILCLSMYHHWFENCGDHRPIWHWLWRHCSAAAEILWEGPVDDRDPVVRANVGADKRGGYNRAAILEAASWFFAAEYVGPALHEPTREVWRFRPHTLAWRQHRGRTQSGAGGATKAFEHAGGRRVDEIERILGWRPVPGSLNLSLDTPFGWDDGFFRAQVLDVTHRSLGLDSEWAPRWARFYPVTIDGEDATAFRFEGERYDERFVELLADVRLRDQLSGPDVVLAR